MAWLQRLAKVWPLWRQEWYQEKTLTLFLVFIPPLNICLIIYWETFCFLFFLTPYLSPPITLFIPFSFHLFNLTFQFFPTPVPFFHIIYLLFSQNLIIINTTVYFLRGSHFLAYGHWVIGDFGWWCFSFCVAWWCCRLNNAYFLFTGTVGRALQSGCSMRRSSNKTTRDIQSDSCVECRES